jgi:hypothetical protein
MRLQLQYRYESPYRIVAMRARAAPARPLFLISVTRHENYIFHQGLLCAS